MIIQEMDLDIRHRAGKTNLSADALSRNPVPEAVVSAVEAVSTKYGEEQYRDPDFRPMFDYLKEGTLPADDKDCVA